MDNYDFLPSLDESIRAVLEDCAAPLSPPAEENTGLEERLDALEQRLERALVCIHDGRKETEKLRELQQRYMLQEHYRLVRRSKQLRKAVKWLMTTVFAAVLALQARPLGKWGWAAIDALGEKAGVQPEKLAGFLGAAAVICLVLQLLKKLCCTLRRKRRDETE